MQFLFFFLSLHAVAHKEQLGVMLRGIILEWVTVKT
jgi:hypothetical protein